MIARFQAPARWVLARLLHPVALVPMPIALAVAAFFCLSSPPATSSALAQPQKERPMAVDLVGGTDWLNTDKPLNLEALRGRVVLLDFWTLCCINCMHILPDLAKLEAKYPGVLVVIGVHTPKFENEKKSSSVMKAIMRYEIKHPVINDADHKIWNAYGVNSWPTFVLIDPDGKFYGVARSEGQYDLLDEHIGKFVKEFKAKGKLKETPLEFKLVKEKSDSPLFFPGKVQADAASKRVFIADSTNHRIVITTLAGKKIAIAGSGIEGFKDGTFAEARFSDPQGMALDGETLYVADRKNHSIRALNLKNETVKTVAGVGAQTHHRLGGPALKTGLNSPWDLLLLNKKIYIAMAGHHQIWTFDPAKGRVEPYAGTGEEAVKDGTLANSAFAQPSGLATDGKHLYVADSESSSVRSVPLPGVKGYVDTPVGVSGSTEHLFNYGDQNGKGRAVRLQHALGIAYLDGKLYVADTYNSKIKIVDPVQRSCDTYLGDPANWTKTRMFNEPGGVCISAGKMYIADTNNHRIQVVDMKTREAQTLPLDGVEPVRRDSLASKDSK